MTAEPRSVRERILDAALSLLRESGVKKFAQPRVAKVAGVPQGHLTYYFPKRLDLLKGVVQQAARDTAEEFERMLPAQGSGRVSKAMRKVAMGLVRKLIKDQERTRTLLAFVVESDGEPSVREGVADHTERLQALLGRLLGKDAKDPDVAIALAALWGLGLQHLVLGDRRGAAETDAIIDRLEQWLDQPPPRAHSHSSGGTHR
ncbi:MAG TPA: TetR/AcrR family transcriptional regulator [Myxococcaceae bacterium]|nr:TetR/AcrR family transcriptional regulator [Myxococcaceae bacterium]